MLHTLLPLDRLCPYQGAYLAGARPEGPQRPGARSLSSLPSPSSSLLSPPSPALLLNFRIPATGDFPEGDGERGWKCASHDHLVVSRGYWFISATHNCRASALRARGLTSALTRTFMLSHNCNYYLPLIINCFSCAWMNRT